MQSFKNRLYNFEAPPPEEMWQHIAEDLQNEKVVDIPGYKKSKNIYYLAVAAASLVILFIGSFFFKTQKKDINATANVSSKAKTISPEKMKDSIILNQKILESIIHSPKEKQEIVSNDLKATNITKKYITVAGPGGQPVKISPKVATLIISADNEFPPKPTWSRKIDRWQKIMLSTTVSTTSAGLADVIQLASQSDKFE
jgi:hypothetical protein